MDSVILGDLHFGVRNCNSTLFCMMKKFFKEEFFPYLKNNNIKRVFQLGDILDKRKNIDFTISKFLREDFFDFFEENEIYFISLSGNHDLYYRQSTELDGPSQFTNGYNYVKIYNKPITIDNFILIPWVCDDNKEEIVNFLKTQDLNEKYVLGHFEFSDFPIQKGYISKNETFNKDFLKNAKKVFSGHYHSPSEKGNIMYVGTPYQLTWSDYGDQKRFIVYRDNISNYEIVNTKTKIFKTISYDEKEKIDVNEYKGCFTKVILPEKYSDKKLNKFLNELNEIGVVKNEIIESKDTSIDEIKTVEMNDTFSILVSTIDELNEDDEIKNMMKDLAKEIYDKVDIVV